MRGRSGNSLSAVSDVTVINSGIARSTNSLPFGPNSP